MSQDQVTPEPRERPTPAESPNASPADAPPQSPPSASQDGSEGRDSTRQAEAGKLGDRARRKDVWAAEQPAFLESLPESPELAPLVRAFVRGDYATIRREAPQVAERAQDPAVRDAALELVNRIRPDPLVRYVLGATAVLLLLLIFWTYGGHAH